MWPFFCLFSVRNSYYIFTLTYLVHICDLACMKQPTIEATWVRSLAPDANLNSTSDILVTNIIFICSLKLVSITQVWSSRRISSSARDFSVFMSMKVSKAILKS